MLFVNMFQWAFRITSGVFVFRAAHDLYDAFKRKLSALFS